MDLNQRTVTVYRDASSDGYRTVRVFRQGERLAPLSFPERELEVADLLG